MTVAEQRELITLEAAAKRFDKPARTIRYWVNAGKIQRYQNEIDRLIYVDAREIERKLRVEPVDDEGQA